MTKHATSISTAWGSASSFDFATTFWCRAPKANPRPLPNAPTNGRAKLLRKARATADRTEIGAVVCMKAAGMADAWCLATNRTDLTPAQIVDLYGRRFTIEESFRDQKDIRFGMGLSSTTSRLPLAVIAS